MTQSSSDGHHEIPYQAKPLIFANYTLIISYSASEHDLHNGLIRRTNYFKNNQNFFKSGKEIHTQVLMMWIQTAK